MPSVSEFCSTSSSKSTISCPCLKNICLNDDQEAIRYFTKDEIVVHNKPDDIWLIIHGWVLDLSDFFEKRRCSMNDVRKSTFILFLLSPTTFSFIEPEILVKFWRKRS